MMVDGAFVVDHVTAEDDWGEAPAVAPNVEHANQATCPAEKAGEMKFVGMLKRGSSDVSWRIAFKTMRKKKSSDNAPMGFPSLWDFYVHSKDQKTFEWGWRKYYELYPDGPWKSESTDSTHPIQELRENICWQHCEDHDVNDYGDQARITGVHDQIIIFLAQAKFFRKSSLEIPDLARKIRTAASTVKKRPRAKKSGRVSPSLK